MSQIIEDHNKVIAKRAHPCLEFFCPSCLPQSKESLSYKAGSVHFGKNYLEFLTDPEIDSNGQIIPDHTEHGNGVFICHSFSQNDRRIAKYLKNVWTERRFRSITSQDINPNRRHEHSEECVTIADIFIVIISPYFSHARHCGAQLHLALKYSKFIIPLIFEPINVTESYPISLRDKEPIIPTLDEKRGITRKVLHDLTRQILDEMEPQRIYIRAHTRILLRAMLWDLQDFDKRFLLNGLDVIRAKNWLSQQFVDTKMNGVGPTVLHLSFIAESEQMEKLKQSRRSVAAALVLLLVICSALPSFGIFFCCAVFLHVSIVVSEMN